MTPHELSQEWLYRYEERLGILCGTADPTPEQIKIAEDEADETVRLLKENETKTKL